MNLQRIFLLSLLLTWHSSAQSGFDELTLRLASADTNALHSDGVWLSLLHYRKDANSPSGWFSQADDSAFFLSTDGHNDPKKELIALVDVLKDPRLRNRVVCRFPARVRWLFQKQNVRLNDSIFEECKAYRRWREKYSTNYVFLDFADHDFSNPASFFGHTFLRFSNGLEFDLLSATTNYVADTGEDRGAVAYIRKGVSGGFRSIVDDKKMFRHLRQYSLNDSRNIWEFRLELSSEQIEMMLDHLWEIHNHVFDYYYLTENCSYRILAVIALSDPNVIDIEYFDIPVAPLDTIKYLDRIGLIADVKYIPSLERVLSRHAKNMSNSEIRAIYSLVFGDALKVSNSSLQGKYTFDQLYFAHQYLDVLINRNKIRSAEGQEKIHAILKLLDDSDGIKWHSIEADSTFSPLESHGRSRWSVGYGENIDQQFLSVDYRMAGHAIDDPARGNPKGVFAEYFGATFRFYEDEKLDLQQVTLIDVGSLQSSSRLFRTKSWRFFLGGEQKRFKRTDDDTFVVEALSEFGKSYSLFNQNFSVLLGAGVNLSDEFDRQYDVLMSARFLMSNFGNTFGYQFSYQSGEYLVGSVDTHSVFSSMLRYSPANNINLSIHSDYRKGHSEFNEVFLRFSRYF